MVARHFWVEEPGRGAIRESVLPPLAQGAVRVRARASGVSRGTESLVFSGRVPAVLAQTMRCPFQEGTVPGPVKYGYSIAGEIVDGPADRIGTRVFCLHPHQTVFDVPADAAIPIPDSVPDRRAVLAANLETAVNALWDAPPLVGQRVTVIGLGTVGLLVAALARAIPGVQLEGIDPEPSRQRLADAFGFPLVAAAAAGRARDLVFHASGTGAGLALALEIAGPEARIVELSWYGEGSVALPLGMHFHPHRLRLISSQVGMIAPENRPRWTFRDRLTLALSLLADPVYDLLVSSGGTFESLPHDMAELARGARPALTHVVAY